MANDTSQPNCRTKTTAKPQFSEKSHITINIYILARKKPYSFSYKFNKTKAIVSK